MIAQTMSFLEDFKNAARVSSDVTVIIKPTLACNLACSYCSVWEKKPEKMPIELLNKIMSEVVDYTTQIYGANGCALFVFHGGEPLLMGLDYYKQALEMVSKLRQKAKVAIEFQTNATLINEQFADFFATNGCEVAVSIDGPEDVHDAIRCRRNGHGSHTEAIRGLRLLLERNIKVWNCATITSKSVKRVIDVYEYFKTLKVPQLYLGFLYPSGDGRNVVNEIGISAQEWTSAMMNLYDHWIADENRIAALSPFTRIIFNLQGKQYVGCNIARCIKRVFGFTPDGKVYPCAVLAGYDDLCYGSVKDSSLKILANCPTRQCLLRRKEAMEEPKCLNCDFLSFCGGGCMHHGVTILGSPFKFGAFCEKALFEHIEKSLLTRQIFMPIDRQAIIARYAKFNRERG